MSSLIHLLQIDLTFHNYKIPLLGFLTAFAITLIVIPPSLTLLKRLGVFDMPETRKMHSLPIPTLGGITIITGMVIALLFWFPFQKEPGQICFFFSLTVLTALGIMDDLRDLSARYKFAIQIALASLIAVSGIRITSFEGLFGLYHLPLFMQYSFTVFVIVGITNAFNLIDGIDGLAGGLGFMSLVTLGIFLNLNNNFNASLIAFALSGGILAFLFFNFNPARIFMGDTGSLVLGFTIAFLCVRLMQGNLNTSQPALNHAPIFALGVVLIPVFDTLRVFAFRIWRGKSPFSPDKTHIHHLLAKAGLSHAHITKLICSIHGFILLEIYWMQNMKQGTVLLLLIFYMLVMTLLFKNLQVVYTRIKVPLFALARIFSNNTPGKQ